eukprot:3934229-Rhodomonas_salina.2
MPVPHIIHSTARYYVSTGDSLASYARPVPHHHTLVQYCALHSTIHYLSTAHRIAPPARSVRYIIHIKGVAPYARSVPHIAQHRMLAQYRTSHSTIQIYQYIA